MGTVMEAVKRTAGRRAREDRAVTPLEELSPSALRALAKLLIARRVLSVNDPRPYEELQRSGYAYRVMSVRNGFVFNDDNRERIMRALHLIA